MDTVEKIKIIESQIESADAEIGEYGDKNDNAANPLSSDILSRMIYKREGLEKQKLELIRVRIQEIDQSLNDLKKERESLCKELQQLEQFHQKK